MSPQERLPKIDETWNRRLRLKSKELIQVPISLSSPGFFPELQAWYPTKLLNISSWIINLLFKLNMARIEHFISPIQTYPPISINVISIPPDAQVLIPRSHSKTPYPLQPIHLDTSISKFYPKLSYECSEATTALLPFFLLHNVFHTIVRQIF